MRGKHRTTKCADCHTGNLYKDKVGTACIDCHKKDDDALKGHKGSLGRDCAACHTESGWKEKAKFDHDKTKFPLLGKHGDIKCADCHKSTNYKEAPKDCIGCHKKDDKHEATLGTKCEACHNERDWKTTSTRFDHDKTKFKLRNAHAAKKVQCKDCHTDLKHYRDTPTGVLRLPQEGRQARGPARREVRELPRRPRLEGQRLRSPPDALPAGGQARGRQVRGLPRDAALQGRLPRLLWLPQEGR